MRDRLSAVERKFLLQLWDNPFAGNAGRDRKRWMQVVERLVERGYLYEEDECFFLTNKGRVVIGEPEDEECPS